MVMTMRRLEAGPWRITLDAPVAGPFLMHCQNRALREQVYRAMVSVASMGDLDNGPRIEKILKLRKEKAQLLGYASHAEISLATKMAPSVDAVDKLTAELRDAAKPKAQEDQDALVAFARKTTGDASLELLNWDIPFWAERMQRGRV